MHTNLVANPPNNQIKFLVLLIDNGLNDDINLVNHHALLKTHF
jgi:hypothetical protein